MRDKNDFALLMIFPISVVVFSLLGFVLGLPISRWHVLLAISVTSLILMRLSHSGRRWRMLIWFFGVLVASVVFSALPTMYTITDGANCHRPAVFLLANGWNPIWQPEESQILNLLKSQFDIGPFHLRHEHITYTPRAAWIYGAALYKVFGFVEVADSMTVYVLLSSLLFTMGWLSEYAQLKKGTKVTLSFLLCLSPHVVGAIFGGAIDAPMYLLALVGLLLFDSFRRSGRLSDLIMGVISLSLSGAIKYSGLAMAIVVPLVYLIVGPRRKALAIALPTTLIMIFLLNASPMLTSWVNHGGPFYPAHSFDKNEKIADNMTFDFDMKNEDAQQMGYAGRFCYAYVSKALTKEYYKRKLGQTSFDPQLLTFEPIDGFGSVYQLFLIASIIGLFFVKDRGVRLMTLLLLGSLFLIPGKYMGYSRYVAQVYAIPILVAIGLAMQAERKKYHIALAAAMCLFAVAQMKDSLRVYPYMWLQSVQNLQTVLAIEKDPAPKVASEYYYAAFALTQDTNPKVEMLSLKQAETQASKYSYGPLNQRFMYLTDNEIPDFRGFACTAITDSNSIMNKTFFAERMKGIEKYFAKEFVPKELLLLPKRFCQTMGYRGRQFVRAWTR